MSGTRVVIAPTVDDADRLASIIQRAIRRGFPALALRSGSRAEPGAGATEIFEVGAHGIVLAPGDPPVPIVPVRAPADTEAVLRRLRAGEPVIVRWLEERVIPLENLVAARQRGGTLWVITDRIEQVPAFLGALEHGADRVIVEVRSIDDLDRVEALTEPPRIDLHWAEVPVQRVDPAGLGDRVIVDTTSLLEAAEGMLVGSQAALLVHVRSEANGSRYTRPRPFRVNAGAAHMYTVLANGETRYLSELCAGDLVLVASPQGPSRAVRVGRIKIERRPLVLVEVEHGGKRYTSFLQEAETVRLSTADGEGVATTDLRAGVRVHGVTLPPARHLGAAVEERIEER